MIRLDLAYIYKVYTVLLQRFASVCSGTLAYEQRRVLATMPLREMLKQKINKLSRPCLLFEGEYSRRRKRLFGGKLAHPASSFQFVY